MPTLALNFIHWFDKNQKQGEQENRHHALITRINNVSVPMGQSLSYFCDDIEEVDRIKNLTYNQFEEEIVQKIRLCDLNSNDAILRVFDLIQIWGGLQGGSNFYRNIRGNNCLRLDYQNWIDAYRELIILSINNDRNAYQLIINRVIPYLGLSFGSKHISFWSRRDSSINPLVIIDNKIAGLWGFHKSSNLSYQNVNGILNDISETSTQTGLAMHHIEKSLFSFHKFYFNNENSSWSNRISDFNIDQLVDYDLANLTARNLGIKDTIKTNIQDVQNIPLIPNNYQLNEYCDLLQGFLNTNEPLTVPQMKDATSIEILTQFENSQIVGIRANSLSTNDFIPIAVFRFVITQLFLSPTNSLKKGNGQSARLGDADCPLNSIEGLVAQIFYSKNIGDNVFRRISVIANTLVAAGICNNDSKGFLTLNEQ